MEVRFGPRLARPADGEGEGEAEVRYLIELASQGDSKRNTWRKNMKEFVRLTWLMGFLVLGLGLQAASTIQFSACSYPVAEDAGTVTLTVLRTNDVNTLVSVDYTSADGTATNGLKYTVVSGKLAFPAGVTNQASRATGRLVAATLRGRACSPG